MEAETTQDKGKEVAFFDAHADSDEYDVFTPQANDRLIGAFKRLERLAGRARGLPTSVAALGCLPNCCGAQVTKASVSTSAPNWLCFWPPQVPRPRAHRRRRAKLLLQAASLDGVLLSGLVHHFPDPRRLAAEVHRVLKPGGRFVAFDPNRNPFMWLYRDCSSPFYSSVGVTETSRQFPAGRWPAFFVTATPVGFSGGARPSLCCFAAHARAAAGLQFHRQCPVQFGHGSLSAFLCDKRREALPAGHDHGQWQRYRPMNNATPRLDIIIPVYNEGTNIVPTLRALAHNVKTQTGL